LAMKNEKFKLGRRLFLVFISGRNVQALDQLLDPERILLCFVNYKYQLGYDPNLFTDPFAQCSPDLSLVSVQAFEDLLFVFCQHHADIDFGNAQVGAHCDVGDRDEGVVQDTAFISLKNISELALNEPPEFLLPCRPCHNQLNYLRMKKEHY